MSKVIKNKKKKASASKDVRQLEGFGLINPHSAGIDIGSMLMVVSYADSGGIIHVREFDSYTGSLIEIAELLQQQGIEKVAMEATGSYWKALYNILESYGMEMVVVNPSHYKNVAARKTDINDSQWLHQLLSYGLLKNSHIAPEANRELRHYIHERDIYKDQKRDTLNRIQKNLTLMNVKVQHLISDIEGVAGMKLIAAICDGVTVPERLLDMMYSKSLKASPEELLRALTGDYQQQYVNILSQTLKTYKFLVDQMAAYEAYIEEALQKMLPYDHAPIEEKTGLVRKNQYSINLKGYLQALFGTDLTEIEGLDEINLLTILSVTGTDMRKWPTAGHFVSWLNLAPRPKISGGKIIGYQRRVNNNPATQAFRLAANSLWQSKGPMGQQYRKLATSKGTSKAIKAVARRIAVIFYHLVLTKEAYNPARIQPDIEKQTARKLARLQKEAAKLGLTIQKAA